MRVSAAQQDDVAVTQTDQALLLVLALLGVSAVPTMTRLEIHFLN